MVFMEANLMNDRVLNIVHEQARAYFEGNVSSFEAFHRIDAVSRSAFNWYPNVLNETRSLFDTLVQAFINEPVEDDTPEANHFVIAKDANEGRVVTVVETLADDMLVEFQNGERKWYPATDVQRLNYGQSA